MSVITAESAADFQSYTETHALPGDAGYLVVEQDLANGDTPFKWEKFPLRIEGVYNKNILYASGDVSVYVPIKGWTVVVHFSGSLITGIVIDLNLVIVKGTLTLKVEQWQGKQWLTFIVDLTFIGGGGIHDTFHIIPIPSGFPVAQSGGQANGVSSASSLTTGDLNQQWLEQLHLFSKLALANGGSLPELQAQALPQIPAAA
ncbi:hypothetical protein SISSUDRAFT_1060317 [Sistotremastrum suecicum HHB10207 ss-3]|uniref:Uncharacterized protein n=1 Tax=Sistotremastrum suecicum HHB10207 ss-3 TaxID=1314776 RepID=A0A166F8H7_9AGAM|nr:hypothetical protein SISSUDRAFT_1060317 [Sistotremastrum suecicum HHB10207 ss-3]